MKRVLDRGGLMVSLVSAISFLPSHFYVFTFRVRARQCLSPLCAAAQVFSPPAPTLAVPLCSPTSVSLRVRVKRLSDRYIASTDDDQASAADVCVCVHPLASPHLGCQHRLFAVKQRRLYARVRLARPMAATA